MTYKIVDNKVSLSNYYHYLDYCLNFVMSDNKRPHHNHRVIKEGYNRTQFS